MYLSFTVLICNFDKKKQTKKKRGEVEERKHDEGALFVWTELFRSGEAFVSDIRQLDLYPNVISNAEFHCIF